MGILDKLFKKQTDPSGQWDNESPGKFMLLGILVSSPVIFNDEWTNYKNRKGQTFELIILSTLLILRKFREIRPMQYNEFEEDIFMQIHLFASQEQIVQKLPMDFADFINSRFILYNDEFSCDDDQDVKIPVHTVYNLFERPLVKDSGICEDLFKVMEVQMKFQSYYERLLTNFNLMISKIFLILRLGWQIFLGPSLIFSLGLLTGYCNFMF